MVKKEPVEALQVSKTTMDEEVISDYFVELQEKTEREFRDDKIDNVVVAVQRGKKRKPAEAAEVVVPPVMERITTHRDGTEKPNGIVFAATYDDANVLGKTLGKLEKFVDDYMLFFNQDGMEISFLDRSHVMFVVLKMPRGSFARYDDLVQPSIDFIVTAKALQQFGRLCKPQHTFTFMYDQCSLADEALYLLLYPNDGNLRAGQKIELTLPSRELEEPVVSPVDIYQYSVRMNAKNFAENVRALREQSDTISMALTASHLAMMTKSSDNLHKLTMFVENQADDGQLDEASCVIKRLVPASVCVGFENFSNYLIGAKYLESAASFGNVSDCADVELRFGVVDNGGGELESGPLHLRFTMRSGTRSTFLVDVYIAPKIDT